MAVGWRAKDPCMSDSVATTQPVRLKARKFSSTTIGDKEAEQILALNQAGWYVAEIADVTGRTSRQIDSVLVDWGYTPRTHKYEQVVVRDWIGMYDGTFDGLPMSFAEIARRTKYCATTIQIAVLRAGVRDRHPSESQRLAAERRKQTRKH